MEQLEAEMCLLAIQLTVGGSNSTQGSRSMLLQVCLAWSSPAAIQSNLILWILGDWRLRSISALR